MKKVILTALLACLLHFNDLGAHCQLPCGVMNDDLQFAMLSESAENISKACIAILQTQNDPNSLNQTIRWVNEKDACANKICTILTEYFLAQRITPVDPDSDKQQYERYIRQLTLIHKLTRACHAAKQSAQPAKADDLKRLLQQFQQAFGHHGP